MLLPHTKIFNFYGPTEATIGVSHWLANGGNHQGVSTLPIGPPMANTHFYVLDADLKQVPVGRCPVVLLCCMNCVQTKCTNCAYRASSKAACTRKAIGKQDACLTG